MSQDSQTSIDTVTFNFNGFIPSVDTLRQQYPFGVYFEYYPKAHHKHYCFIRDQGTVRVHLFSPTYIPGVTVLTTTPHESRVLTAIHKEAAVNSLFVGQIEYNETVLTK